MMDRKQFIRAVAAGGAGAAFFAGTPWSLLADEGYRRITVLHTNDTHARIEPFPENTPELGGKGGVLRRATLINKLRKENPHNLLLDAGDVFQGTPYFNMFGGALDFEIMSYLKYDACTIGNHEFDNGVRGFVDVADQAKFPFVSANYDFGSTAMSYWVQDFITRNVNGIRIGIFGLGVDFENLVLPELHRGVSYKDPVETSKQMVDRLKGYFGCDMVICLSHIGYDYDDGRASDRVVAKEVPGLDLILGGHTHTFLDEPEEVIHEDDSKTIIAQVGHGGVVLGRIDLFFNGSKQLVAAKAANNTIDEKVAEDRELKRQLSVISDQ